MLQSATAYKAIYHVSHSDICTLCACSSCSNSWILNSDLYSKSWALSFFLVKCHEHCAAATAAASEPRRPLKAMHKHHKHKRSVAVVPKPAACYSKVSEMAKSTNDSAKTITKQCTNNRHTSGLSQLCQSQQRVTAKSVRWQSQPMIQDFSFPCGLWPMVIALGCRLRSLPRYDC